AAAARAAGKVRTPEPTILEIDARKARETGIVIMQAGKTVYLADQIPPELLRRSDDDGSAAEEPADGADA
ncbi:MAG TPA: hypothetical protein VLX64_03335, partial [Thermoplasmata archaeon]|nr:hypothetical protein [Thermoplasmata archaeon]